MVFGQEKTVRIVNIKKARCIRRYGAVLKKKKKKRKERKEEKDGGERRCGVRVAVEPVIWVRTVLVVQGKG